MENEFNNNEYFYNTYYNNPIVVIPKPLMKSNNFLIMEFIDGEGKEIGSYQSVSFFWFC